MYTPQTKLLDILFKSQTFHQFRIRTVLTVSFKKVYIYLGTISLFKR